MNILTKVAVSGLVLSMASFASAASISGSTDFRVTLPEILVLYHWDDAHLILTDTIGTPANDSDPREISDDRTHSKTTDLSTGNYTITENPIDTTSATNPFDKTIEVTLENSWAVRSLSTGDVTLGLETRKNGVLKNLVDDSSIVTVKDAKLVSDKATGGSNSTSVTLPSQWEPITGDITFNLDLSEATRSGEYNMHNKANAAGDSQADNDADTFLLTLTGN